MTRKRVEITLYEKSRICDIRKKYKHLTLSEFSGIIRRELSIDVGKSTLSGILKNSKKLDNANNTLGISNISRISTKDHNNLEMALYEWINQMNSVNGFINNDIIVEKAKRFAEALNITNLQFSSGWLWRFKKRLNLKSRRIHGEANNISIDDVKELRGQIRFTLENIDRDVILNMDETGLFYREYPTSTISSSNRSGMKASKERITVALCCNANGTIKIKPFIIGKSKMPRCFKNFQIDKFCYYNSNAKAWMTSILFQKYLDHISEELMIYNKKFYLLIDNCPCHIFTKKYDNLEIIYLPKNSTSHLQPLDAGIIRNLKHFYGKNLVTDYMYAIDNNEPYDIDLKKATQMISAAWNNITANTIVNCFNKTGIIPDNAINNNVEIEEIFENEFEKKIFEFEEELNTGEVLDDQDIIKAIQDESGTEDCEENIVSLDNDDNNLIKRIENDKMMDSLKNIIEYASCSNDFSYLFNGKLISELNKILDDIREYKLKTKHQTKIYDFFNKLE